MLRRLPTSFGLDMLVGARVLLDRRDMQPALVREGALADIGGVAVGRAVEPVVEQPRDVRQPRQLPRGEMPVS